MERTYDKVMGKITYIIAGVILVFILYFILLKPYLTFKRYEKTMIEAGKKYYEINSTKLPTGRRVSEVSLLTLSNEKYIEKDFTIPLTSKLCNLEDSWIKVKYGETDYEYYAYLDCGLLESKVDHEGPVIKLNGDNEITVTKSEKFTDPGINSVVDKNDGKMNISDVTVKGKVDTNTTGKYTIKYTAFDSLKNKTEVVRKITVIDTITSVTKRGTNNRGYYPGNSKNNYINFSNQLYRIIGIDGDNVKIVSDQLVAVSNYAAVEKQLKKYYDSLSPKSRSLVTKNKYCNDKVSENNTDLTECSSHTGEKMIYIPSLAEVNKAQTREGNFMISRGMTWTSNSVDDNNIYIVGQSIPYVLTHVATSLNSYNVGIRPVLTIKGNTVISDGKGTDEEPFIMEKDLKAARGGEAINERIPGEYFYLNGKIWRIMKPLKDGTTMVVMDGVITTGKGVLLYDDYGNNRYDYNPKTKDSYAYNLNNRASEFLSTKNFESYELSVPIYKDEIMYGKEVETKKYKVKLAAPNMYDLFGVAEVTEHLLVNTSKDINVFYATTRSGGVIKKKYDSTYTYAVRPVARLKKGINVVSGEGSKYEPYIVK